MKKYSIQFEKVAGSPEDNENHAERLLRNIERNLDAKGIADHFEVVKSKGTCTVKASAEAIVQVRKTKGVLQVTAL